MTEEEYADREVGWVVTVDHTEPGPGRAGWGQLRVHADETLAAFDRIGGRTVFMDTSLTTHMIPEGMSVRWRSFDDDMNPYYDGIIRIDWIVNSSDDDDLAFNIDRFVEADAGAVHVYYSVEDMTNCLSDTPDQEFTKSLKGEDLPGEQPGAWVEIFS